MNMNHLIAILIVMWVVGVLSWMYYTMVKGISNTVGLQVIRIRIAAIIAAMVSILLLYGNAMLTSAQ